MLIVQPNSILKCFHERKGNMIKVKVATHNIRGFLRQLFETKISDIEFEYLRQDLYEISSPIKMFILKILKSKIFDYLGVFQVITSKTLDGNMEFSYNRFLNTNKPYVIFLENPAALVNYFWKRPNHRMTKYRLKTLFASPCLKSIICMSKVCKSGMESLYSIPGHLNITQIYPLVKDDNNYSEIDAKRVANGNIMECLYISSAFYLKGGRDLLFVFKKLEEMHLNMQLTVITRISDIRADDMELIKNMTNVHLYEFNLNQGELNEHYKKSSILLNPTRMDSFSLVTLEAIKYGCAIIATDMYAIREMVTPNINGYLFPPMYPLWRKNGLCNTYYLTHKKETLNSVTLYTALIGWMHNILVDLYHDRKKLAELCVNSLRIARNEDFSEKSILAKWDTVIHEAVKASAI